MKALSYTEGRSLIKDGDVLLFRGKGWISRIIGGITGSPYTHVGLANWVNNVHLECIHIREFKGGVASNLSILAKNFDCQIDVYRAIPHFTEMTFNMETKEVIITRKDFDGSKVADTFRGLLGQPYNYRYIWNIFKYNMMGLRIFYNKNKTMENGEETLVPYHICSSGVAHAFSKNGYDLVYNRGDAYNNPGDLARSPRLNYLFTLCEPE